MSDRESQGGLKSFSYAELCEKARKNAAAVREQEPKEENKRKGLEFMALRFNVIDKRRELQRTKAITPAESCLLQEIELGTIGARNKKKLIGSLSEFYIEDLSNNLGYKTPNKIWALLKSLEKKGLIIRQPTRSKGLESIGLNPNAFGQLLIDKEHVKEKKRFLKLVHNSETSVDKSKSDAHESCNTTHESSSQNTRIM